VFAELPVTPAKISCYVLTHNSAAKLHDALSSLMGVVDDLLIVDSGSADRTIDIAASFGARVETRLLDDFTSQRRFAVARCLHDWVLCIDSDEVLSAALKARLLELKLGDRLTGADQPDAYAIRREWFILNRKVRVFYPSHCPDFPIRLFHRNSASYTPGKAVHENMSGFRIARRIDEPLLHYSCSTIDEMYGKMNLYTTLAARDLRERGRPSLLHVMIMPWIICFTWYVVYGGWRDGLVGAIHARYVFDTIYQKYLKARYDFAGGAHCIERTN
jgi:glycosyltransferase involved in cell wall biosynthesis